MNTEANKLFEPSFDPTLTEGLIALIRNKPVAQDDGHNGVVHVGRNCQHVSRPSVVAR